MRSQQMMRWIQFVAPALLAVSLGAQARVAGDVTTGGLSGADDRTQAALRYAGTCLKTWQDRLALGNWHVSVEIARAKDLRPKTVGQVEIDYPARRAVIQVLDPVDHRLPEDQMLALVESVVVHELVHITLTPVVGALRGVESTDSEEERAVRHITAALLAVQKNGHN
jgi:hypothetical protein